MGFDRFDVCCCFALPVWDSGRSESEPELKAPTGVKMNGQAPSWCGGSTTKDGGHRSEWRHFSGHAWRHQFPRPLVAAFASLYTELRASAAHMVPVVSLGLILAQGCSIPRSPLQHPPLPSSEAWTALSGVLKRGAPQQPRKQKSNNAPHSPQNNPNKHQ